MGVGIWNSGGKLPPKSKDALPDSDSPHGPCPRCGRSSNFTVSGKAPLTFNSSVFYEGLNGKPTRDHTQQVSILTCQGCGDNVVAIENKYTGGELSQSFSGGVVEWRGFHWWPAPGMQPGDPDIPAAVSDAVAEGTRCLAVQAPRAAVVMFRGALAEIVHDKGSTAAQAEKTLFHQLKKMADEGDLDKTLADWAKEVRELGNAGAHPSTLASVSQDEAEELLRLINEITSYVYVNPARVQRSRAARQAKTPSKP